jgi:hypothetical protein
MAERPWLLAPLTILDSILASREADHFATNQA